MPEQGAWRFCQKCEVMFFDGFPGKGSCPAGGPHQAQGFVFVLPFDVPETPTAQGAWRFCQKCFSMFFDGFPGKGSCPAGGGHQAQGFVFVLPHDIPGPGQRDWRFCQKCFSMFFDGFPNKGVCAAGGPHQAQGFLFVLPHDLPEIATFDSGPLTSNLPLGGSVHLEMRRNGDFTFSCHAHDSGFDNIDYVVSAVLLVPSGQPFTFQHSGHVEGTSAGLPFGTPQRNDDFTTGGNNPAIANEFGGVTNGRLVASIAGKDKLVGGLQGMLNDLLHEAASELGQAAVVAAIALVL
jgi:hypothetical protein